MHTEFNKNTRVTAPNFGNLKDSNVTNFLPYLHQLESLSNYLRVDFVAFNTGVNYGVEATGGAGDVFATFFYHDVLTDLAWNLPALLLLLLLYGRLAAIFDCHQGADRYPSLDTASLSRHSPGEIFSIMYL